SARSSTRSRVIDASTPAFSRGTMRLSFSATLYCLPAISTIAYMSASALERRVGYRRESSSIEPGKNHRAYTRSGQEFRGRTLRMCYQHEDKWKLRCLPAV